jgi:hypothetical protein
MPGQLRYIESLKFNKTSYQEKHFSFSLTQTHALMLVFPVSLPLPLHSFHSLFLYLSLSHTFTPAFFLTLTLSPFISLTGTGFLLQRSHSQIRSLVRRSRQNNTWAKRVVRRKGCSFLQSRAYTRSRSQKNTKPITSINLLERRKLSVFVDTSSLVPIYFVI